VLLVVRFSRCQLMLTEPAGSPHGIQIKVPTHLKFIFSFGYSYENYVSLFQKF